ncbi:hypothetical protein ABZ801_30675 [Actinomadura sp. NPDC047616]|uniref:hypothetical protein n=1 Tax=Actinomadura sp. NPDC047616 TaxID=3155914 RepID=UPI003408206D
MSSAVKHWAVGAAGVAVAAGVNLATGLITRNWGVAWLATAGLVVAGGCLQVWMWRLNGSPARQRVHRTTVDGNVRQRLPGTGEQSVTDSHVGRDLEQSQGDGA